MSKKLPHQISVEDLLASLETSDDTQELVNFTNDVPYFLSKFKLEAGDNLIRPALLYKLYKIYSEEPVSQVRFSVTCRDFVPRDGDYFKLNISPIKLIKLLNPTTNRNQISSASLKRRYEAFIESAKVTKGSRWVEGFMLYEVYRFNCIDNGIKSRIVYEQFIMISKLYFEHRRIGSSKGFWFKLDENTLDILPLEHQENIRNKRRMNDKERNKRSKASRKKNSEKKPS